MQIIDADGHVNDRPCMDEISRYMPPGNRTQVFPSFDHIHFHYLEGGDKRSRTGDVGPKEWINFLDETEIDWTAVYPTAGLAVGRILAGDCGAGGGRCVPPPQHLAAGEIRQSDPSHKRRSADSDSRHRSGRRGTTPGS